MALTKYIRTYPIDSTSIDADVSEFDAKNDEAAIFETETILKDHPILDAGERCVLRREQGLKAIAEWRGGADGKVMRIL